MAFFGFDLMREKQHWGKKKKKNILRFVTQQLLEMRCQSGAWSGTEAGTAAVDPHTTENSHVLCQF